jgi:hypothetical protein
MGLLMGLLMGLMVSANRHHHCGGVDRHRCGLLCKIEKDRDRRHMAPVAESVS